LIIFAIDFRHSLTSLRFRHYLPIAPEDTLGCHFFAATPAAISCRCRSAFANAAACRHEAARY
jgi:hypothetical protein